MWPDQRRAVPDLLFGRLGQPPGERVADRLAGPGRSVRLVAQGQSDPLRERSPDGPPGAARRSPGAGPAGRSRPRRPTRARPCPRTGAARGSPAPRGSPGGGCCAAGAPDRTSPGRPRRPVTGRSTRPSRAVRRRPGEPAIRSISSGAKRTTRSVPARLVARRGTPFTRIRLRWPPPPSRRRATSRVDPPPAEPPSTTPSTRARSAPQRIISASVGVRCEWPEASTKIASSRLVLPAALGPWTRCGPGPSCSSRAR